VLDLTHMLTRAHEHVHAHTYARAHAEALVLMGAPRSAGGTWEAAEVGDDGPGLHSIHKSACDARANTETRTRVGAHVGTLQFVCLCVGVCNVNIRKCIHV
jgi:hypothetical protein